MDHHAIEATSTPDARPFGRRADQARKSAETRLFRVVQATFAVRRGELRAPNRGRCKIAFARQTGMYLARVALGMTLADAGRLFGRDRTTASYACRIVEDLRDDPKLDAILQTMEMFVAGADTGCEVRQ